jgi:hypothetical protein
VAFVDLRGDQPIPSMPARDVGRLAQHRDMVTAVFELALCLQPKRQRLTRVITPGAQRVPLCQDLVRQFGASGSQQRA